MAKSRKRPHASKATVEPRLAETSTGQSIPPLPLWFRPLATTLLGAAYIATAMALLVMSRAEEGRIGAVCGKACGGTTLFGVSLEWWGAALMVGVIGARWWAASADGALARQAVAVLALGHAGASFAFAASQWLGVVDVCPLCQVAAFFSIAVAMTCLPIVRSAFTPPWIPALQSVALGIIGVMAVWSSLDGVARDSEPVVVAVDVATLFPSSASANESSALQEVMDALTMGNPDAPFEFVMVTDFDCAVCERFETRQLPLLLRDGVDAGLVRVRFLLTRGPRAAPGPFHELAAATSLAMAGVPVDETFRLMKQGSLNSSPQGIARVSDAAVRDRATEILQRVSSDAGWENISNEHDRRARELRQTYFPGRSGTPVFVMVHGRFDSANPPPPGDENVLALYGYQLATSFLEFAGVSSESN